MGSPSEIREMLQLAADKATKPRIEEWPMSEANSDSRRMDLARESTDMYWLIPKGRNW